MSETSWRFATRAVHGGIPQSSHAGPSATPIYQTAAFSYSDAEALSEVFQGRKPGHIYSRISNPTVDAFELRLASLERGVGAIAVSSGMAAITSVVLGLAEPGDEIVASKSIFGGTILLIDTILRRYGITVRFFQHDNPGEIHGAISDRTRFVFVESIGNPRLDVTDIARVAAIAHERGIPLVVDSTLTTAYLLPAASLGADVVIYSGTKYINGSGTAVCGAIVDVGSYDWREFPGEAIKEYTERFGRRFAFLAMLRKQIVQNTGAAIAPVNAFLCAIGLETLAIRMEKHCSNALELAKFLNAHGWGLEVFYPGLTSDRYHSIAKKQFCHGYGGLVAFRAGSKKDALEIINSLSIARHMTNMGEAKTLVLHPESTIFLGCTSAQIADAGVSDDMIRISVGLEDVEDIKEDFDRALRRVKNGVK